MKKSILLLILVFLTPAFSAHAEEMVLAEDPELLEAVEIIEPESIDPTRAQIEALKEMFNEEMNLLDDSFQNGEITKLEYQSLFEAKNNELIQSLTALNAQPE